MSKNKIGKDSPISKFIYLKIRRRDGVESLTTLEEGEFKVPIDGCIKETWCFLGDKILRKLFQLISKNISLHFYIPPTADFTWF